MLSLDAGAALTPPPLDPLPPRRPRPPPDRAPPPSPPGPAPRAQSGVKPTSSGFTVKAGFNTQTPAMFGVSDWAAAKALKNREQRTPSHMMTNSTPTVPHRRRREIRRRNLVVLSQSPRHTRKV
jgi:hypothetical protein